MNFDTSALVEVLPPAPAARQEDLKGLRALPVLSGSVVGGEASTPVDDSDAQLLAYLDSVFKPLLDAALAVPIHGSDPNGGGASAVPAQLRVAPDPRVELQSAPAGGVGGTPDLRRLTSAGPGRPGGGLLSSRWIGGTVVGLEVKRKRDRHGRVVALMVRLVLFGPAGQTHECRVERLEPPAEGEVMSLTSLLGRLVDEAEQRGLLSQWPQDIILLGQSLADDLAVFDDADALQALLQAGGSTVTLALPLPRSGNFSHLDSGTVHLRARAAARQEGSDPTLLQLGRALAKPPRQGPRVGLGPRLYVGFDAEWTHASKGRNRILSVQFVVYGPGGQSHERLFDLAGDHDEHLRLTLADALDVVLDEAEQECVFEHWPREVVLMGFFLRGDLTVFADFEELRPQIDALGTTMGTLGEAATITLPMDEQRQARLKSRYQSILGDAFDPRLLKVDILDVSRLTPPGTSLAKVGEWLNQPKIVLPAGYDKADMLRFKRREPEKFRQYALHDARLAVLYGLWVLWFADRHLGLFGLSATVSAMAVRLAELCMRRDGVHPDVALNFEWVSRQRWSDRQLRVIVSKDRVPTDVRRWLEPFLADVYQGGRNESYIFGPSEVGRWYDSDLAGAYVTGLSVFMTLDYDDVRLTTDPQDFVGHVAGFAKVDFQFPVSTYFPCLPVQVGAGLWFTRAGTALCTSFEIELALAMGAELRIRFGVVIGWKDRASVFAESAALLQKQQARRGRDLQVLRAGQDDSGGVAREVLDLPEDGMTFPPPDHGDVGYRPMESFAIHVRQMRLRYRRKSLPFEFMKVVGNGLYGKTGQGFKGKRGLRLQDLGSTPIGPSRVSEAAIAALVCGFVRATVSEILWKLPAGARVVSLTTDGALMDVPTDQLDLSGAICRRYQALVDRVAPGTSMIEPKHQVRQVFVPRTRGCFTVEADLDEQGKALPMMSAKAGHKVVLEGDEKRQAWLRTPAGESDWMIRLALGRHPGQTLPQESFIPLRETLVNGWDLQMQTREVKVSLEYDFKRQPVNPRMVRMGPYDAEHLAFDTVPWKDAAQGERVREIFRAWRVRNCLKTMDDWHRWMVYLTHQTGNRQRRMTSAALPVSEGAKRLRGATGMKYLRGGEDGLMRLVVRTFLAALTQGVWGLADAMKVWSYKELAKWLSGQGYPVSVSDIKNARRTRLDEGVAADTPEVRKFLAAMQEWFPGLEVERFFCKV